MKPRISVIVPTCGRPEALGRLLQFLSGQQLADDCPFEVIVALDGGTGEPVESAAPWQLPTGEPLEVRYLRLERVGISAAKNAAVAASRGDVLLFVNDDVEPYPDFVQQHAEAHAGGHSIVLGQSPWVAYSNQTLFDEMIARTRMIFFYSDLVDGRLYGFRHAWNLNLSIGRARLEQLEGPFCAELRPFFNEDLELAHRLMGDDNGIYYSARAVAPHRHRYTLASYHLREALAGVMAASLARVNPTCFSAIYGSTLSMMIQTARHAVETDQRDARRVLKLIKEQAGQPTYPGTDGRLVQALYAAHLPLKRRAFRIGLLARESTPRCAWVDLPKLAADALRKDELMRSVLKSDSEPPESDRRTTAPGGP